MGGVAAALPFVGGAISAVGQYREGKRAKQEGRREARQLRVNAKQEQAYAQLRAGEQRRQAGTVESRAKAVAAATGGGGDTSTQKIIDDIASEGEYRAMIELYEGDEAARGLLMQAAGAKRRGDAAYKAGRLNAVGSLFGAGGSMYEKYGGTGGGGSGGGGIGMTRSGSTGSYAPGRGSLV